MGGLNPLALVNSSPLDFCLFFEKKIKKKNGKKSWSFLLVICIGICNYALGLHCYIFQAFLENDVLMLQQSINAFFRVPILQDPFFVANSTYVPIIYNVDLLLRMILKHLDMNL